MSTKYSVIVKSLQEKILTGKNTSYKLPTEQQLADTYRVSRQTIRRALSELKEQGIITGRQGSGWYAVPSSLGRVRKRAALLLPSDSDFIYPSLIRDITDVLNHHEMDVRLLVTERKPEKERIFLRELLNDEPCDLILAEGCQTALPTSNDDLYRQLEFSGLPVLFLFGAYPNLSFFPVLAWNIQKETMQAAAYLRELGHFNLLSLINRDAEAGILCYQTLRTFLRDLADTNVSCLWYTDKELTSLQQKKDTGFLSELIDKNLMSHTAILCDSDEIAYRLIRELTIAGIGVPEKVSVLAIDSSFYSRLGRILITSFSAEEHLFGRRAGELAWKYYLGERPSGRTLLNRTLNIQGSCHTQKN